MRSGYPELRMEEGKEKGNVVFVLSTSLKQHAGIHLRHCL